MAWHNMPPSTHTRACAGHSTTRRVCCMGSHKTAHHSRHRQPAHLLARHLGQLVGQLPLPLSCRPVEHTLRRGRWPA